MNVRGPFLRSLKNKLAFLFFSVTARGWKFEKTAGCVFRGQRAVYLGPGKALLDEEGHTFPRGLEVEICTDTAAKLSAALSHTLVRLAR